MIPPKITERLRARLLENASLLAVSISGPHGLFTASRDRDGSIVIMEGASVAVRSRGDASQWGPPLWARMHSGARTAPSPAARLALIEEITAALPRLCGCQSHWRALLTQHPPEVATAEGFSRWTWSRHNDVRTRQGKQPLSWADFEVLYPPEGV